MPEWYVCRFQPIDVLAGADARALEDGGWGHEGEISPAAFSGAIRTALLEQGGWDFALEGKKQSVDKNTGQISPFELGTRLGVPPDRGSEAEAGGTSLRVAAPLLWSASSVGDPLFWPVPRCYVKSVESDSWLILSPSGDLDTAFDDDLGNLHVIGCNDRSAAVVDAYARLDYLCTLLTNPSNRSGLSRFQERAKVWTGERRYGHERAESGTVMEARLFSRAHLRFCDRRASRGWAGSGMVALVADTGNDGLLSMLPHARLVRMGGDGRLAQLNCSKFPQPMLDHVSNLREGVLKGISDGLNFILYLATPAVFQEGWRPPFHEEEGVRLIAAAVGRPQIAAGWDAARKRPKPVRRVVPAGSVYWYSVTCQNKAKELIEQIHLNESVCPEFGHLGYGLALVGGWPAKQDQTGKET